MQFLAEKRIFHGVFAQMIPQASVQGYFCQLLPFQLKALI
jgi:hypothetical protein